MAAVASSCLLVEADGRGPTAGFGASTGLPNARVPYGSAAGGLAVEADHAAVDTDIER